MQEIALCNESLAVRRGHHIISWKTLKAGFLTLTGHVDKVIPQIYDDYSCRIE
jgi:hypothetical protein